MRCALVVMLLWSATASAEHVRIDVALVEHKDGARRVVSGSRVEGPAGVDLEIELRVADLVLTGTFITDLAERAVEVNAHLVSRRRAGESPRGLPLWEEDVQDRQLAVGFGEALVLWPFGRAPDALSVELVPARAAPIALRIEPFARTGALEVRARRHPHRFVCTATLVAPGATAMVSDCRFARAAYFPAGAAGIAAVTVAGYQRDRPADAVSIRLETLGARAMATVALGAPATFALADGAQLRLVVRLADGEAAD